MNWEVPDTSKEERAARLKKFPALSRVEKRELEALQDRFGYMNFWDGQNSDEERDEASQVADNVETTLQSKRHPERSTVDSDSYESYNTSDDSYDSS